MKDSYQAHEIVKALGITRERFNDWAKRGYISASIHTKKGSRVYASYTVKDIFIIVFFKYLVEVNNLSRSFSSRMTGYLKNHISDEGIVEITQFIMGFEGSMEERVSMCSVPQLSKWPKPGKEGPFLEIRTGKMALVTEEGIDYLNVREWISKDWRMIYIVNLDVLKADMEAAFAKI